MFRISRTEKFGLGIIQAALRKSSHHDPLFGKATNQIAQNSALNAPYARVKSGGTKSWVRNPSTVYRSVHLFDMRVYELESNREDDKR